MTIALRQRPLARVVQGIVAAANGAWFDPSDLSTLYQDAAGTTPVTAVEQPVGLWLDKSYGLQTGPELVSNGTFDSGMSGWSFNNTAPATISAIDGIATWNTSSGGAGRLVQEFNTVAGKSYKITYEILSSSGGAVTTSLYDVNSSTDIVVYSSYAVGKYSRVFIAKGSVTRFQLATANYPYTADNFSVRELYGYHATQSITASRPTLSARKNILLATEALATQSVTTLAAQYTLSFTGAGSVTLSGTATGTLTGNGTDRVSLTFTPTAGTLTLTVSGSVTKAQLELGAAAGQYQRVTTTTNYDTDERYFKKYLRFDGIDDYFNLPYMGLYANGSASVVICKNESSNEPINRLYITEASISNSAFYSPIRVLVGVGIGGGSLSDNATVNFGFTTPLVSSAACIEAAIDSGTLYEFFRNGDTKGSTPKSSSLTTTLGNTTIGIRRAGGGFDGVCSMNLYGLIITKSALTDSQRIKCERFLARKAGVML